MRILMINGPNMNTLGERDTAIYGSLTLNEIEERAKKEAKSLGVELYTFQSNHEGSIIDFIQAEAPRAQGIIINPGALTHYGLSLREALADTRLPVIEVHISNIFGRESFRRVSVTAEVCWGMIAGLGWRSYVAAVRALAEMIAEAKPRGS